MEQQQKIYEFPLTEEQIKLLESLFNQAHFKVSEVQNVFGLYRKFADKEEYKCLQKSE